MANATFIKVRYWNLRRHELDGVPLETAMEAIQALTPESAIEMIDKDDKAKSNGSGPRYVSHQ